MKVVVTGGAGFIGSHITQKLIDFGHDVIVIDNLKRGNKLNKEIIRSITLLNNDIRDYSIVNEAVRGCDLIFHFAAVLGVDIVADNPVETMEIETIGMQNIAKAAIEHGNVKIVYASTSGVYGKAAIQDAVDEEFEVSPKSSYSIAKRYNEIYLKSLFQEKNLDSISLRFFNVYGPKQDTRMVIPRFFEQALHGKPVTIYGTGDQTRDFTYIDDVVEAVIRVGTMVKGCEIINVSNNKEYSINNLAEEIIDICKSDSIIEHVCPPSGRYDFEVERRFGNSAKLKALTGFSPETSLKEGLKRTMSGLL